MNKNALVIMLTVNVVTGIREQFLETRFVDCLFKPVSGDKLESMFMKYLPKGKCWWEVAGADATRDEDYLEALTELNRLYPKVDLSKGIMV